jgi:hypothetical protein
MVSQWVSLALGVRGRIGGKIHAVAMQSGVVWPGRPEKFLRSPHDGGQAPSRSSRPVPADAVALLSGHDAARGDLAMTLLGATLALVAVLFVASIVYVGWRDRRRLPSAEDSAAHRVATSDAERYAAEGHVRNSDNGAGF